MAMKKGAKIGLGIFAGITAFVVVAVAALFVILYGGRGFKTGEYTAEEKETVISKLPVLEKIEQQRVEGTTRGKKVVFSQPKEGQVTLSQGEVNALLAVRDFKAEDLASILEDVFASIDLEAERASVAYKPAKRGPVMLSGAVKEQESAKKHFSSSSGDSSYSVTVDEEGNIYDQDGKIVGKIDKNVGYTENGGFITFGDSSSIADIEKLGEAGFIVVDGNNGSFGDSVSESNGVILGEEPNSAQDSYRPEGDTKFLKYENGVLYYGEEMVANFDGKQITLTNGKVIGTVDKNNDIIDGNKAIIGEIDGDTVVLYGDDMAGQIGSIVKLEGISAGISGDVLSVNIGIARCKTSQPTIDDYLSGSVIVLEFKTANGRIYLSNVKINGLGADLIPEAVLNSLPDYNGGGIIQYLNDNLGEAISATFEHIFAAEEIRTIQIKDGQILMDGTFYQEVTHE